MLPRKLLTLATITTLSVATAGGSINLEYNDGEMILPDEERRATNEQKGK